MSTLMYSIVYIFELLCKGGKSFMMVTKDIFEDIVLKIPKCQYISDLRSMIERNDVFDIITAIEKIEANEYSVKQWHELYQYLFKESNSFKTAEDIKDYILSLLKK